MADKPSRQDYREAARRLAPGLSVEEHANVQPMADGSGAFVEMIVWVPREAVANDTVPG